MPGLNSSSRIHLSSETLCFGSEALLFYEPGFAHTGTASLLSTLLGNGGEARVAFSGSLGFKRAEQPL